MVTSNTTKLGGMLNGEDWWIADLLGDLGR
jgi:hypothetical protein